MLNAEDLFETLSNVAELKALFCAQKPVLVIDSETGTCLWCNVAAAQQFGCGGLADLIDQPLQFLQPALGQLKSLTGRLHFSGQQTLARLPISGSNLGALSTVSVKRVAAQSYTRPVMLRFLEGRETQVEQAQIARFFFSYEDLKARLFPSEERQTAFSFVGYRSPQQRETEDTVSSIAVEKTADTASLTYDEENNFQAIAEALGQRLGGAAEKAGTLPLEPHQAQELMQDGEDEASPIELIPDGESVTEANDHSPAEEAVEALEASLNNSYILDDLHKIEQTELSEDETELETQPISLEDDHIHFIEDAQDTEQQIVETEAFKEVCEDAPKTVSEEAAEVEPENEPEKMSEDVIEDVTNTLSKLSQDDASENEPEHAGEADHSSTKKGGTVDDAIDAFVAALAENDDNVVALTWPLRNDLKNKSDKDKKPARPTDQDNKIVALAHKMHSKTGDKAGKKPLFQPVIVLIDAVAINANDSALKLFEVQTLDELNGFEGFKSFAASLPDLDKVLKLEVFNANGEPMRLSISIKQLEADQQTAQLLHLTRLDISGETAPLIEDLADETLEAQEQAERDDILALVPELGTNEATELESEKDNGEEDNADVVYLGSSAFEDLVADLEDYQADESSLDKLASLEEDLADLLNENEELERALFIAKQKEAELRAVIGTSSDGVLVLDEKGQIISMNAGAEALLGREELDVIGLHFSELLTLESRSAARSYFEGVSGYTVTSLLNDGREVKGLIGDGRNSAIALFLTIGRLGDQDKARYCAVFRDITPWKRTEAELQDARRRAEVANQQKSDFLAKISHEIRAPLNAIIGFSEVMLEERFGALNNQRYRSYLQDIRSGGSHIISLVNDLLDLAKIEAGRMQLDFKRVNVNEVMRSVQSLMQNQAHSARVIMRYSLSEDLPEIVADERSIKQVLINLVSNAIKFTNGGGQVILSTRLEEDGSMTIRVRDTGEGMDKDELNIALQPFRQVSKKENIGGTGLGLPLSKALAEANHASFEIESEKNKGTTVSLVFAAEHVCANQKGKDKT